MEDDERQHDAVLNGINNAVSAPILQRLPMPNLTAGPVPHIQYTLQRLLTEIDESDVRTHPVMTDLRRNLLTVAERINTDNNAEPQRSVQQRRATVLATRTDGQVRVPQTSPEDVNSTQRSTVPQARQRFITHIIRSSSQVFARAESQDDPGGDYRQRTAAQDLRDLAGMLSNPAVQAIAAWLIRVSPFLLIFVSKWMVEHCVRILLIVTAVYAFIDANARLARLHSSTTRHDLVRQFFRTILLIQLWMWTTHYWLKDDRLFAPLFYSLPNIPITNINNTLWAAFTADSTAKFIFMTIKAMICMMPVLSYRRRGRIVQCIEYCHQFYRYTMTPILWAQYYRTSRLSEYTPDMQDASRLPETALIFNDNLLVFVYIVVKILALRTLATKLSRSARNLAAPQPYGKRPTAEAIAKAEKCTVCFGELDRPIELSACRHIFCERCIDEWLSRERTCPVCRQAIVNDDLDWTDSTTTCLIQLF